MVRRLCFIFAFLLAVVSFSVIPSFSPYFPALIGGR
jgi:hypothetical protein